MHREGDKNIHRGGGYANYAEQRIKLNTPPKFFTLEPHPPFLSCMNLAQKKILRKRNLALKYHYRTS